MNESGILPHRLAHTLEESGHIMLGDFFEGIDFRNLKGRFALDVLGAFFRFETGLCHG